MSHLVRIKVYLYTTDNHPDEYIGETLTRMLSVPAILPERSTITFSDFTLTVKEIDYDVEKQRITLKCDDYFMGQKFYYEKLIEELLENNWEIL